MDSVCMLLNGPIKNDHRVIKMINTLSKKARIDLYYINGKSADKKLFNKNISLFSYNIKETIKRKIVKHTLFCYEFNFMIKEAVNQKKSYKYIWANDLPTLYPAYKISRKLSSQLIYDSHEIYLETLNQFFHNNGNTFKQSVFRVILKLMKVHGLNIEKKCSSNTQAFITVNDSLKEYFIEKYKLDNCISIMNFPNSKFTKSTSIDFRKKFNWSSSTLLLIYQGTINKGRGLDILIETMSIAPKYYKLIIIGDGTMKNYLKERTINLNIVDKVKFINQVPINELSSYSSGADIGINLLENYNLSKKLASPNKLFEYIHSGIPVLCSDSIENKKITSKFKIGELTTIHKSKIIAAIKKIENNGLKYYEKSLKEASTIFEWENQEKKILNLIN